MNAERNKSEISAWIKHRSVELGFAGCGIAEAAFLSEEAPRLGKWLKSGMHGEMGYMANYNEKRLDPRKLLEGAKSVIVFLYNYYPEESLDETNNYILSKYAYGEDYHFVIKEKLGLLISGLKEKVGPIEARTFVDSAPVLERAWAVRAGLGWIGKNAHLISPKNGSFFFLAEIITDLELDYDIHKSNDLCGTCRNCIDACPTKAIIAPRVIDARKCISYLTIELKNEIPAEFSGKLENRIFGCDICQDVCPWNNFSKPHREDRFRPHPKLLDFSKTNWENLTPEQFNDIFEKSAVKRAKYTGLTKNIDFIKEGK
nr:tRNA epoxyqueuosine(34) reductase QueG [Bacteroidota bacterium]